MAFGAPGSRLHGILHIFVVFRFTAAPTVRDESIFPRVRANSETPNSGSDKITPSMQARRAHQPGNQASSPCQVETLNLNPERYFTSMQLRRRVLVQRPGARGIPMPEVQPRFVARAAPLAAAGCFTAEEEKRREREGESEAE